MQTRPVAQGLFLAVTNPEHPDYRLICGCAAGRLAYVQQALEDGADTNVAAPDSDWTALMYAAWGDNNKPDRTEMVRLLLERGADPRVIRREFDGRTALHYAAMMDNAPMVQLLLTAGADAGVVDINGMRPVDVAPNGSDAKALLGGS